MQIQLDGSTGLILFGVLLVVAMLPGVLGYVATLLGRTASTLRLPRITRVGIGLIGFCLMIVGYLGRPPGLGVVTPPPITPVVSVSSPTAIALGAINMPTTAPVDTVTSAPIVAPTSLSPTAINTIAPTLIVTGIPSVRVGYNFETGIGGWDTDEGQFKLAALSVTTNLKYSGAQALQVTTSLYGNASPDFATKGKSDPVYTHTVAKVYFSYMRPEGINDSSPYNLNGKTVSCFVYLPTNMASPSLPAQVFVFVKDSFNRNQVSSPTDIVTVNTGHWLHLSLVVSHGPFTDTNFDPTQIGALGVFVKAQDGSKFSYSGSYYIDACSIQYP